MRSPFRVLTILLISVLATSGCGQKGPLFLPGDPSQIRTLPDTLPQDQDPEEEDEPGEEDTDNQ